MYIKIVFLILVVIFINGCDSKSSSTVYNSSTDSVPPVLILNGDKNITLETKQEYIELGFEATDNIDGEITDRVEVNGEVDVAKLGSYVLTYSVKDSSGNEANATRVINVVDTTPPVLTLIGDSNTTLNAGHGYEEFGFNALDNVDGNITENVVVNGSVDTAIPGEYILNYSVKDSSGNEANATRVINVIDTTPPVLTLIGDKTVLIPLDKSYEEAGFIALDNTDGNTTKDVLVSGLVDTSRVGIYNLEYSVKDSSGNEANNSREVIVTTFANAKLGALADAKVDIYKFDSQGNLELLWSESTSSGEKLEDIGKFNTHAYELDNSTLYLYNVSGGKDYDSNNDGIKDSVATDNSGEISAIATKEAVIETANNFNITLLSQLNYELVKKSIKYNYNQTDLLQELEENSKDLINDSYTQLLKFDPVENIDSLNPVVKASFSKFVDIIHSNLTIIANLSQSVGNIETLDFARSITKSRESNLLYIADGSKGISVVDTNSNMVIKNIQTKDFVRKVALSDDESIAYVADSKEGFSVVDIKSNSIVANIPTYETNTTDDYDARYVTLSNSKDIAYVAASKKGIMVIDISIPQAPKLKKVIDTPDTAYKVELLDDNTILVADGESGVLEIDLDTNQTIDIFNTYGTANSFTFDKDSSNIYIADGYKGLVVAHLEQSDGTISYLGSVDTPDYAGSVTLSANRDRAYVADRKSNIQVVDLTKDKPEIVDAISTPYRSYDLVLSLDESLAYVATGTNGLEVVTLRSIVNPAILSSIASDYRSYSSTKKDNILYISQGYKGLQVVDTTSPLEMKLLNTLDTDGFSIKSVVSDNRLYLADGYKGLQILDITTPSSPIIVENIPTNDFTNDIALIPNSSLMLVSNSKSGIALVNSTTLSVEDELNTTSKALAITLSKDAKTAYIAVGDSGIDVIKIENSTLAKLDTIDIKRYVKSVTLNSVENRAYIAGGDGIVTIYDLENNQIISDIKVGTYTSDVALSDNEAHLYVTDDSNSISIVDLNSTKIVGKVLFKDKAKSILLDGDIAYISVNSAGVVALDVELLRN